MIIGIDMRSLSGTHRTGVGEYAYEIISALVTQHKEHEYVLFSNSFSDTIAVDQWNGDKVTVVQTKLPNKLFHLLLLLKVVSIDGIIKRRTGKQVDYVFTPNLHFTHLKQAKQVLTIHDLSFILYKDCYSLIDRLWHRLVRAKQQMQSAKLVAPSENTKRDIRHVLQDDKKDVMVIPHGVSSLFDEAVSNDLKQEVTKRYKLPPKYLIMIGTVEPRKNMLQVITAFGQSRLALDGYELLIAGGTGYKAKRVIDAAEKTAGVRMLAYIPAEHKVAVLSGARALIYPSLYEGFGLPIIEAMALGTPVLTSNRSSMPEASGGNAVLVNPDSSDDIARGIKEVIGKERAVVRRKEHDWKAAASSLNTLFI